MTKKISISYILFILLSIAPLITIALLYDSLPDQVPNKWSNGTIYYSDKIYLWILGFTSPIIAIFHFIIPKIDPIRKRCERFRDANIFVFTIVAAILNMSIFIIIYESLYPSQLNIMLIINIGVGLLFIVLGNALPKFKRNFFIGFRTPWTLSNDEVWLKTHRLAGFICFFGGFAIIIISLLVSEDLLHYTLLGLAIPITIIPYIMSYVWHARITNNNFE